MKIHFFIWPLLLYTWIAAPSIEAVTPVPKDRIYSMTVTEMEDVVNSWLSQQGFHLMRLSLGNRGVKIIAGKAQQEWQIILMPHSPLNTKIIVRVPKGQTQPPLAHFWRYVDSYIRLPNQPPNQPVSAIPDAVRQHIAAVVCIYAVHENNDFQITGFVVDPRGLIVCTAHDLARHQSVNVALHNGRELTGRVIKIDSFRDLALVDVDVPLESTVSLDNGRYMLRHGNVLFAVTCPYQGVSGIQRGYAERLPRRVNGLPLWQARMPINPGSSGSPVFDSNGRLAAVVKGRFRGTESVGFLIPLETLEHFLNFD